MFVLSSIIGNFKRHRRPLYACFVDLSKAYGRINHNCLFFKLLRTGFTSKFVRVIKDIYEKSYSRVKIDSQLSDVFQQKRAKARMYYESISV
jgi:hypothetical protein